LVRYEFGITKNKKIVIFQVRPLIAQKKILLNNIDEKISKKIQTNKKKYEKLSKSKNLFRKKIIFSDMSDWNPAEILGDNPNLLDYSLYDFLIMEKIWQKGRTVLGYYDIYPTPLMVKFGNKPYVDVRASFTSLIPKEINNKLKNKLMKFYFEKLEKNPRKRLFWGSKNFRFFWIDFFENIFDFFGRNIFGFKIFKIFENEF